MSGKPVIKLNARGCCAGTPALITPLNRPGLSALAYRIGTYATFLRNMLAQIHSVASPDDPDRGSRPLAALTTRTADDPAIALLDAWAVVADVLTFYQERIANEGFLRTATERLSVLELARMIGYELSPGVAASAFLAFNVNESPGAPGTAVVPQGSKVQNVPPQGKLPQGFETIEDISTFAARNQLQPRLTRPQDLALVWDPSHQFDPNGSALELYMLGVNTSFPDGSFVMIPASQVYPLSGETIPDPVAAVPIRSQVHFSGTTTNLKQGDRLLLVGRNDGNTPKVRTQLLIVRNVEAQSNLNRTAVDLRPDLAQSPEPPPFVPLRLSEVVIDSELAPFNRSNVSAVLRGSIRESDLSAYMTMNKWSATSLVLLAPIKEFRRQPPPPPPLPSASAKLPPPDPGIFAMRTHVGIFGNNAPSYTSLLAPNGLGFPLPPSPPAIGPPAPGTGKFLYPNNWDEKGQWPIWKDSITGDSYSFGGADIYLEQVVPSILRDSWIVLEFPDADPQVYRVGVVIESALAGFGLSGRATGLRLTVVDGSGEIAEADKPPAFLVRKTTAYGQSDSLDLADLPIADDIPAGATELMLDGLVLGLSVGQPVALSGSRTADDAPGVTASEVLILQQITHVGGFTTLQFTSGLLNSYVRSSVRLNANVAHATHGETVNEVLGSGDASQSNQSFTLKRPPLTYVAAQTPSGAQSTLAVRVNNLLWPEVPSLFGLGPRDQGYIVRLEDDGATTITFGDGVTGARLPSGSQNITAGYRTGIGLDGNVDAGSLTLLQTRPPGILSVTNPVAAAGAAAPESLAQARVNAPLKVLTLDRIVSLDDYENFARAFAGIGKAQAVAIWSGTKYLVHLTIAGANGAAVSPESALYASLGGAIDRARDPVQQVLVASYQPLYFDVTAEVLVDQPRFVSSDVLASVAAALENAFSFDARSFAQPVTAAEVTSVIQSVPGVIASDLTRLFVVTSSRGITRFEGLAPILCASQARFTGAQILPAELLLVNPAGIVLSEMQP